MNIAQGENVPSPGTEQGDAGREVEPHPRLLQPTVQPAHTVWSVFRFDQL